MRHTHATPVWLLIATMAVVTGVSLLATGISVDVKSNSSTFLAIPALIIAGRFYRRPHMRAVITAVGQMLLILLLGELLTYPAATANFPYRDAVFYAVDQALGFNRHTYLQFFNMRPWLNAVVGLAYLSLLPQFAFLPLLLNKQMPRLQTMMLATGIALFLTTAISVFTPAIGAFIYVDLTPTAFANISSQLVTPVLTLEALRTGAFHTIELNDPAGLISFPSFHTTGGLLLAWALWETRFARWLALGLNATLIAATPVFGGHYFVDVLAGTAVTAVSIFAAKQLCRLFASDEIPKAILPLLRFWRRRSPTVLRQTGS